MANSEDPDQTTPSGVVWSGSALFAFGILSETLVFESLGLLQYSALDIIQKVDVCLALYTEEVN